MSFYDELQIVLGKTLLHEARLNELLQGLAVAREQHELIKQSIGQARAEVESITLHLKVEQMLQFQQKVEGRVMTAGSQGERDAQFENYLNTLRLLPSEYRDAADALKNLENKEVMLDINYTNIKEELSSMNGLTQLYAAKFSALQPALEGELWLQRLNEAKIQRKEETNE